MKELVEHQVYVYRPENRHKWDEIRPRSRKHADYPEGESPESYRDKAKQQFLAEHGIGELEANTGWTKFGFPLNWNSNVLEAMYALAIVDTPMHKNLERPLQVIQDKITEDGRWLMEKSLNGQMWADVEVKGQPSKWITLFAMIVLNHFTKPRYENAHDGFGCNN